MVSGTSYTLGLRRLSTHIIHVGGKCPFEAERLSSRSRMVLKSLDCGPRSEVTLLNGSIWIRPTISLSGIWLTIVVVKYFCRVAFVQPLYTLIIVSLKYIMFRVQPRLTGILHLYVNIDYYLPISCKYLVRTYVHRLSMKNIIRLNNANNANWYTSYDYTIARGKRPQRR